VHSANKLVQRDLNLLSTYWWGTYSYNYLCPFFTS